jgi:hypothetical protein
MIATWKESCDSAAAAGRRSSGSTRGMKVRRAGVSTADSAAAVAVSKYKSQS